MLRRLASLAALLMCAGCLLASPALAHPVSIHANRDSHSHWLRFDTGRLDLSDVARPRVKIGRRHFSLNVRRLRTAGHARAIVITGVVAVAATGAILQLTDSHHPASEAATGPTALARSAVGPIVRLSPIYGLDVQSTVPADPNLVVGINVGSAITWELQFARTLGARDVRMAIPIDTPVSQLDPIIAAYSAAGIRPELLATFDGTIPDAAQDAELADWAARYGPGGSFWSTGLYPPSSGVTRIEFGNETSYNYQYPKLAGDPRWYSTPLYTSIAERYAQSYVQAVHDVSAANPKVRVLAVADSPGQVPQWLDGMFKGAPNLASVVQGWIIHPYGNTWRHDVTATLAQAQSLGASSQVPVYVTEVGVATSGGQCLQSDYGWNPCLSFAGAGETLSDQVSGIENLLGGRLAELDLYSARDLAPDGSSTDPEDFYGALQSGGQPKGAFTDAVERILATTSG